MNHVLGLHYNIIPLCSLFLTKISNLLNGLTMHIFTLLSTSLKYMGVLQKAFYPLHLSIASHFTNIFTNSLDLFLNVMNYYYNCWQSFFTSCISCFSYLPVQDCSATLHLINLAAGIPLRWMTHTPEPEESVTGWILSQGEFMDIRVYSYSFMKVRTRNDNSI
jgi:hypothetical protein